MDQLQRGFPVAIDLSLKQTQIKGKSPIECNPWTLEGGINGE